MNTAQSKNEKPDHGEQNARGWSETIAELIAALNCDFERLEELRDEREGLQYDVTHADSDIEGDLADAEKALREWDDENGEELKELIDAATLDGEEYKDRDAVYERIQESPLSVQVRSGWHNPGEEAEPEEFEILLTTGGPALRIRGELGEHNQPQRAWLEYQDWGTPWTEFHGEGAASQETLVEFCACFYFGD